MFGYKKRCNRREQKMSDPGQVHSAAARVGVLRAARDWLERDGRVALATVIDTWGSAPVPVGGQLAIAADGSFEGSVSGGCIEGEVITEAEEVLNDGRPRALEFGVADETAWRVGLPCGGQVRVFVERLDRSGGGLEFLEKALAADGRREGILVRTRLSDGQRTIFEKTTPNIPSEVASRLRSGESKLIKTPDEGEVFLHAMLPPARIVVIGATHIAQVLCELARLTGYEIIVIDPRTAFASPERFPGVTLRAEWPQDALPQVGLDPYTAVVVVAHVSHIDDEALKIAVKSNCLYIGALGSSRNHAKRRQRLMEAGLSEEEIGRIKNPIGLDIGAQTPAEIATAIMAEVILAVRGPKAERKNQRAEAQYAASA
jgi:xanthine dehydrogenase accessory factor